MDGRTERCKDATKKRESKEERRRIREKEIRGLAGSSHLSAFVAKPDSESILISTRRPSRLSRDLFNGGVFMYWSDLELHACISKKKPAYDVMFVP